MNFGSVCSGIEAASVAFEPLGWKAAWFAEIEPFPCAVLAHHYPTVPNLGDMTTIARRVLTGEVPAPDVLCGGTPCQAFSVAGLRESLSDARGNLTLKFVELADAIDFVRDRAGTPPCVVKWENVPGVLSTKDNAFGCFLAGLAGEDEPLQPPGKRWEDAGAVFGPKRAIAWRTLDAQFFGLAQRRRRVFVVASAREGFDPAQVLLEWDGVRRDSAPSRQQGSSAAIGNLGGTSPGGGWRFGADEAAAGQLIPAVATCLTQGTGLRYDADTDTDTILPVAHTLRGEGFDASEDGTGRGTPLVPVAYTTKLHNTQSNQSGKLYEEYATSLDANSPPPAVFQPLPFDTTQITSDKNRSKPRPGDPCHPLAAGAHAPAIAFDCKASGQSGFGIGDIASTMRAMGHSGSHQNGGWHQAVAVGVDGYNGALTGDVAATMGTRGSSETASGPTLLQAMQVRRLTPRECERLQGFPDDYTLIPTRPVPAKGQEMARAQAAAGDERFAEINGVMWVVSADGPRYKALGNSWAVPVVRWIGARIDAALRSSQRAAA